MQLNEGINIDYNSIKGAIIDFLSFFKRLNVFERVLIVLLLTSTGINLYQRNYIKALEQEYYKCYKMQNKALRQADDMYHTLGFIKFFIDKDKK